MIVKAKGKHIRISPKKIRQVIDLIRDRDVTEAKNLLLNLNKRPKEPVIKLLNQAIANARVKGLNSGQLYISKIVCDGGPMWKRFKAAAFGRASKILKRTSHIKIELDIK